MSRASLPTSQNLNAGQGMLEMFFPLDIFWNSRLAILHILVWGNHVWISTFTPTSSQFHLISLLFPFWDCGHNNKKMIQRIEKKMQNI